MHIIFLNGSRFRGHWGEFIRALWHPLFIGLVLAMTAIIFLVQPYDHILPDGVISRTLIVTSSVALFLGISIFILSCFAKTTVPAYSILVIVPAIACTSFWAVGVSVYTGGTPLNAWGWAQLMGFNLVFCVSGEIILSSFLLRRIAEETGLKAHPIVAYSPAALPLDVPSARVLAPHPDSAPAKNPEPRPNMIEILGQHVALDAVWHLKAEEHYVRLGLRDGTSHLLRGRLADAIAQVPDGAGLQVHRSHWVAASALADLDRRRDGWRIKLRSGAEIPVARNRQASVRNWFETMSERA